MASNVSVACISTVRERWLGSDVGEPAVPIRLSVAAAFIRGDITKDQMLSRYFPKPMQACREVESEIQKEMLGY